MFISPSILVYKKLNIFQFFLLKIIIFLIKKIDVPRQNNMALINYASNFKFITKMSYNFDLPWKFVDFSLDFSEHYYYDLNTNIEIFYYTQLILKTSKKYWTFVIFSIFFLFWKNRWLNIFFFIYSISLPFIFFFIILYIDYLEGCFDE